MMQAQLHRPDRAEADQPEHRDRNENDVVGRAVG